MAPSMSLAAIPSSLLASLFACWPGLDAAAAQAGAPLAQDAQISEYVREVFQDRDGSYWFGTNDEGVCRYDGTSLVCLGVERGLAGSAVRGIVQDGEGAMWFATDGGVSRYREGTFTSFTVQQGLSDDNTWSILGDRNGIIWVGTMAGVCRFDGTRFVPFPLPRVAVDRPESRFNPTVVFAMHQSEDGSIWFGTDGEGVHRYDGRGFTSYTTKEGLGGNLVRAIGGDRRGRVWVGSDGGGVSCFDGSGWRTFTSADGLSNDRVFDILEDRVGNMWFSTLGAGASRYDGTSFAAFGAARGLGLDDVRCACGSGLKARDCHVPGGIHVQDLFEDREGRLWAGCSGGLFRLEQDAFINVTRGGPWPTPTRQSRDQALSGPLEPLSRLIGGEWRVTFANGTRHVDRWSPGPGGHSASAQTFGTDGEGNPWRALAIHHWHPGRQQVRVLGFHPEVPSLGRGHSEGSARPGPDGMTSLLELRQSAQPQRVRRIESRIEFDGPDALRTALLEDTGEGFAPLVEWGYVRSRELSDATDLTADTGGPSELRKVIEPLLERFVAIRSGSAAHSLWRGWRFGSLDSSAWSNAALDQEWEAVGTSAEGTPFRLRTTFEWIAPIEVLLVKAGLVAADGGTTPLIEAYLFHPVGTEGVKALGLSKDGGVFEGAVVLEGRALEATGEEFGPEGTGPRRVRLDLGDDGTLRTRVWTERSAADAPVWDLHHVRRAAGGP